MHRSEKTPGSKYSSTSGLYPRGEMKKAADLPPAVEAIKDAVDGEIVEGETAPGDLF